MTDLSRTTRAPSAGDPSRPWHGGDRGIDEFAFAGTLVTRGQAEGLVWAIGNQTEIGRHPNGADLAEPDPERGSQWSTIEAFRKGQMAVYGIAFSPGMGFSTVLGHHRQLRHDPLP